MDRNFEHVVSAAECRYAFAGVNLAELRRAQLRKVVKGLGLAPSPDMTKQQLLKRVIHLCATDRVTFTRDGLHPVDNRPSGEQQISSWTMRDVEEESITDELDASDEDEGNERITETGDADERGAGEELAGAGEDQRDEERESDGHRGEFDAHGVRDGDGGAA